MSPIGLMRTPPLTGEVARRGAESTLVLRGELDLGTLPVAERMLAEAAAFNTARLVLDLRGVVFFDLTGLRMLFTAAEQWGDGLELVSASEVVEDLISFSGLRKRFARGPGRRPFGQTQRYSWTALETT